LYSCRVSSWGLSRRRRLGLGCECITVEGGSECAFETFIRGLNLPRATIPRVFEAILAPFVVGFVLGAFLFCFFWVLVIFLVLFGGLWVLVGCCSATVLLGLWEDCWSGFCVFAVWLEGGGFHRHRLHTCIRLWFWGGASRVSILVLMNLPLEHIIHKPIPPERGGSRARSIIMRQMRSVPSLFLQLNVKKELFG